MDTKSQTDLAQADLAEADLGVGRLLVRHGAIGAAQLDEALELSHRWRAPLADVLMSRWWLRADVYSRAFAAWSGLRFVRLSLEPPDRALLDAADASLYARRLAIPWRRVDGVLLVAAPRPDPELLLFARAKWGPAIDFVVTSKTDVIQATQDAFRDELSHAAVMELAEADPDVSARQVLTRRQAIALYLALSALAAGLALAPLATLILLNVFMTLFHLGGLLFKLMLVRLGGDGNGASARAMAARVDQLDEADLPVISILVPMFREPDVLPILVRALRDLDYPQARLDIKIVLEEHDHATIAAARAMQLEPIFEIILVPESRPKTKPKACNYALNFARGEFVVVYDAEDKPEPDQLRKVVAAFRAAPDTLACVQCRLNYYNARENWLTRMFTLDYSLWFDLMLPGLQRIGAPIPLGGTSNHFRASVLRELHAWDPFNVTEDADLGMRLAQKGYRVGVIDSTTWEEANCHAGNWIRQRSRWIKGYMMTVLVHTRRPRHLLRSVGPLGVASFLLFVGGTALSGLLNPIYWAIFLAWLVTSTTAFAPLFPPVLLYICLFNLIAGNGLFAWLMMIGPFRRKWTGLAPWALGVGAYWALTSIAAWRGLWQLVFTPFYWEKTNHGISTHTAAEVATAREADRLDREEGAAMPTRG